MGSKERTKRNYFDEASALFKYAKGMGWFPLDRPTPTANTKRPKAEDTDIETFTPEEVRALLAAAKELKSPAHPVIALICFSGSRTEEIAPEYSDKGRLHWENILPANSKAKSKESSFNPLNANMRDSQYDQIYIPKEAAKKRKLRYMPLLPNLKLILKPYLNQKGPIYSASQPRLNKEFTRIAKKAGVAWNRNALRHSYEAIGAR